MASYLRYRNRCKDHVMEVLRSTEFSHHKEGETESRVDITKLFQNLAKHLFGCANRYELVCLCVWVLTLYIKKDEQEYTG